MAAVEGSGGHEESSLNALSARVPLCTEGMMIRGRWRISRQIGMGAFGEIYVAQNTTTREPVAIKVEPANDKKQALRAEVAIMRKLQGCPCVCQFISCGRQGNINYLVMELLGENLSDLRKKQARGSFSMATVCRLGCEMVQALQAVHEMGVMHRDVKPSNFVLGGRYKASQDPSLANKLYIIDFGLSRKYVGPDGEIKPPRPNAGFRGTARYASVNSHQCKELSPRDDLWSVFYMMVEFATGTLPWRNQRDRDKVGEIKQKYMTGKKLTEGLPSEFEQFMAYLQTLDYYSKPDYTLIHNLFHGLLMRIMGLPPNMDAATVKEQLPLYDWESRRKVVPSLHSVDGRASGPGTGAGTGAYTPRDAAHKKKEKRRSTKRNRSTEGGVGSTDGSDRKIDGSLMEDTPASDGKKTDEDKHQKSKEGESGDDDDGGKRFCSKRACTLL